MASKGNLLTDATFRRWETAIEFVYRYMSVISAVQPQRRWIGGGEAVAEECQKNLYRIKFQTNASFGDLLVRLTVDGDEHEITIPFDIERADLIELLSVGPFAPPEEEEEEVPEYQVLVKLDGQLNNNAAIVRFIVPDGIPVEFAKISQSASTFYVGVTPLGKLEVP